MLTVVAGPGNLEGGLVSAEADEAVESDISELVLEPVGLLVLALALLLLLLLFADIGEKKSQSLSAQTNRVSLYVFFDRSRGRSAQGTQVAVNQRHLREANCR